MSKKITYKNIYNFFEGNSRMILSKLGIIKIALSTHIDDQIAYRLLICKDDCVPAGKCKVCGCGLPGRAFSSLSCNKERFPDIMSEEDWINYKKENNIK
jgi:hypothetical protein